jgi:hypothetical protein
LNASIQGYWALLIAKEKKMGIMVRKGFITPQNKQHEKQYRFKIVSSLFYIILFRASKGSKN